MSKVRVGVIGAGNLANMVHYPSLAECDDVELVAIADLSAERLQKTGDRFGVTKRYANGVEMMDTEELDAVYVLMPPHHLFDLVMTALAKKLHVFVEKPPAVTTFQVESMARAAEANGCLTMTGFNRRFIPVLRQLRDEIHAESTPTQVVANFYKSSSAVYYRGAIDILHCDAIHAVDALRWLAGSEPQKVTSIVSNYGDVVPNAFNALIQFENGATGTLHTNWNVGARTHTFEIHAPKVSAFVDPDGTSTQFRGSDVRRLETTEVAGSEERHRFYGFYYETRHFIDSIKAGVQPETNFADAAKSMKLADAILANSIA